LKDLHCAASGMTLSQNPMNLSYTFHLKTSKSCPNAWKNNEDNPQSSKFCYSPWKDLPPHLTFEIDHFNFPFRENVPERFSRRLFSALHERISHEPEVFAMRVPKLKQAKSQWQIYRPHDTRSK
jgi:hypothetical protein